MISKTEFLELREKFAGGEYQIEVKFVGSNKDGRLSGDIDKCLLRKTKIFVINLNSYEGIIVATKDCIKDSELGKFYHPFACKIRVSAESLKFVRDVKKRER